MNDSTKTKRLVSVPFGSGEIVAFHDDLITRQIIEFGNHARPELAFALSVLDSTHRVFDIGAHIGTFSLTALKKVTAPSKLLAVEGNPESFAVLQQNLVNNGRVETHLVQAFCGGSQDLVYEENPGNTGGGGLVPAKDGEEAVSLVGLDSLAEQYFEPDYLKLDIEGAELAVLEKSQLLGDCKPIIYVEVSKKLQTFGHDVSQLDTLLRRLGYRFFVNTGERNASHDLFRVKELLSLSNYRDFFDALCVHETSDAARALRHVALQPAKNSITQRLIRSLQRFR